ncbi:MAG TPA: WS/DGAT domain-containing protein, partial [Actinomycetota bacterium]|nr:WS/DGAT domain-containing protein [Actinomycetota bacterium]
RPLWEAWLLPGLPGRVGLFLRVHHTMVDGVAGMAALGALLDLDADAPSPVAPPWTPAPLPTAGELLRDNLRRRLRELGRGLSTLTHPRRPRGGSSAVWREFFAERAPRTSLNRPIGAERRLAVVRGRLDVARQVAHAHNAKVNDVVLAAVAGGLRRLLAARGEDVQDLVLRVMVPVSLHHEPAGSARGNQGSVMLVPLPLGEPDPVRRLELIAAETAPRKGGARPQTGSGLLGVAAVQRAWYRFLARQRTINLVVTNVPGPPVPLYLAGARLLELFPVAAIMGNITLAVAVFSYDGQLNLTAIADRDTCPDVEVFAEGVRGALGELGRPAPPPLSRSPVGGGRRR